MQKILFLFIWFIPVSYVYSQTNTVSTGSTALGNGSVSYSVGQIDYRNQSGLNGNINQGVHQPHEFYLLEIQDFESDVNITAYPNPTAGICTIESEIENELITYSIVTLNGTYIQKDVLPESGVIDLSNLPPALYLICISTEDTPVRTFKIQKK